MKDVVIMKYCSHCCTLFVSGAVCPDCSRPLVKDIKDNDPVCVISADGFERERIIAALSDAGIPCVEHMEKKEHNPDVIMGNAAARVKIEVPYCAYEKAKDILIGIGAIKTNAEILDEQTDVNDNAVPQEKAYEVKHKSKDEEILKQSVEEFEEMSPLKRNVVRIVSALLFVALVALVVFGVDFIANLIKGLF